MGEKRLTAFSGETSSLHTTDASLFIRVNLPGHEEPALYSTENIYCLESWERIEHPIDWSHRRLTVLGTFPTLQALRDEHHKGLEILDQGYETGVKAVTEQAADYEDEELKYKQEIEDSRPIIEAAQSVLLGNMVEYGQRIGVEPEKLERIRQAGLYIINSQLDDEIIEQRSADTEKSLWFLFKAEDDAEFIEQLIDWFHVCSEAPYTVLHNPTETNPDLDNVSHLPRAKVSQELVRQGLSELVNHFKMYGTIALDGEELVDKATLDYVQAIAEGRENEHPARSVS